MTDKRDRELNDELESHLRMAAQDKMDRGASREEAEAAARREMGNAGLIKEVTREQDGWHGFERLMQDVRFGLRVLRKNRGFTVVSVLTLALGIGASTAIFSVVYGVLLRSLPYDNPDQIIRAVGEKRRHIIMRISPIPILKISVLKTLLCRDWLSSVLPLNPFQVHLAPAGSPWRLFQRISFKSCAFSRFADAAFCLKSRSKGLLRSRW